MKEKVTHLRHNQGVCLGYGPKVGVTSFLSATPGMGGAPGKSGRLPSLLLREVRYGRD